MAVDSFGGAPGSTLLVGDLLIGGGGNLADDHPVSTTYDTNLSNVDPGLADPATKMVTIGSGA